MLLCLFWFGREIATSLAARRFATVGWSFWVHFVLTAAGHGLHGAYHACPKSMYNINDMRHTAYDRHPINGSVKQAVFNRLVHPVLVRRLISA